MIRTLLATSALLFAASAVHAQSASADLVDASGSSIGKAELTQTPAGVLLAVKAKGIPAGEHAFHIHETGRCDADGGFTSAGGHFALDRQHGFHVDGGPHPGDMPNVTVRDDGVFEVEVLNANVSLKADGTGYLFDDDGSALVIHAAADDYRSQPSGDAGARIACGIIKSTD